MTRPSSSNHPLQPKKTELSADCGKNQSMLCRRRNVEYRSRFRRPERFPKNAIFEPSRLFPFPHPKEWNHCFWKTASNTSEIWKTKHSRICCFRREIHAIHRHRSPRSPTKIAQAFRISQLSVPSFLFLCSVEERSPAITFRPPHTHTVGYWRISTPSRDRFSIAVCGGNRIFLATGN